MSKTRHYPEDSKIHNRQVLDAAGLDRLGAYHALMEERRQQMERHLVEAKANGLVPEISSTLLERLQSVSDLHDEKVRFLLSERTRYEYQALVAPRAIGKTRFGRPLPAAETRQTDHALGSGDIHDVPHDEPCGAR